MVDGKRAGAGEADAAAAVPTQHFCWLLNESICEFTTSPANANQVSCPTSIHPFLPTRARRAPTRARWTHVLESAASLSSRSLASPSHLLVLVRAVRADRLQSGVAQALPLAPRAGALRLVLCGGRAGQPAPDAGNATGSVSRSLVGCGVTAYNFRTLCQTICSLLSVHSVQLQRHSAFIRKGHSDQPDHPKPLDL